MEKYPCKRKNCANKQRNGRCKFEYYIPKNGEDKCEKFIPKTKG